MKISSKVHELILAQINIEFTNHAIYKELANWAAYAGYKNACTLFTKQSNDELVHRDKFCTYLLNLGYQIPQLNTDKHLIKASTLEQAIKVGYTTEQRSTEELLAIKRACEDAKDYVSSTLLDWYLNEQVEEEALFIDLLDVCKHIGLFDEETPSWAKKLMRQQVENRIGEIL